MEDSFTPKEGTLGKVFYVDDAGTIHVNWTNGSTLGIVFGVDKIERIDSMEKILKKVEKFIINNSTLLYL